MKCPGAHVQQIFYARTSAKVYVHVARVRALCGVRTADLHTMMKPVHDVSIARMHFYAGIICVTTPCTLYSVFQPTRDFTAPRN